MIDWQELFGLNVSALELVVRGSVMYLFLFLLFRAVIRRSIGAVGMADILVVVIIADAAQNGMSGEYRSITEGAILVSTIVGWNLLVDSLAYLLPTAQRLLEPPPLLLVHRGRILHRNLRVELVSEDELRSKLREHGVADVAEVAKAYMESDGEVTVIKRRAPGASSL